MKKIVLSVCAIAAMSSLSFAGGDFVTPEEPVVVVPVVVEEESSNFYVGIGLTAVSTRDAAVSVDWGATIGQDRLGNISLLAGYNFNEYIAAEGRYTTSFTHEDNVEMSGWSIFVKPQYPVTEDFSVYALLGVGGVILDGVDGAVVDVDDTEFQWGLGASYMVTDNVSLFADYTWLTGMEGVFYNGALETDVDEFTIGVNYHF